MSSSLPATSSSMIPDDRYYSSPTPSSPAASSSMASCDPPVRKQTRYPIYRPVDLVRPPPRSQVSRSEDMSHNRWRRTNTMPSPASEKARVANERTPLLRTGSGESSTSRQSVTDGNVTNSPPEAKQKPFYRARPLWLVPFAIAASLVRGMTLAPRVEVYTQLACYSLHGQHEYNHTAELPHISLDRIEWSTSSAIALYSSIDPLGPHLLTSSSPSRVHSTVSALPFLSSGYQNASYSASSRPRNSTNSDGENDKTRDPRRLPSQRCLSDPAVQAKAARLQTLITTIMGLLSALTTGWWGHFGERHGRTKVLAIATFGLFWTDLIFILTSTPTLPFPLSLFSYTSKFNHAHHLLLLAPLVEGLLGGWSTLQSATSAYISDCTSPGSRAQIFSRFTGVFYLGFSIGPAIAGWLIRHPGAFPVSDRSGNNFGPDAAGKPATKQTVTAVFWVAVFCSFVNFLLVLLVFPESLTKEKQDAASKAYENRTRLASGAVQSSSAGYKGKGKDKALDLPVTGVEDVEGVGIGAIMDVEELSSPRATSSSSGPNARRFSSPNGNHRNCNGATVTRQSSVNVGIASGMTNESLIMRFLRPLAVFLPVYVDMPTRNGLTVKRKKDWSLTLLAAGLFGWMLSTGVYQIKYLYAGHVYEWGAEQLSYYISFMGGARAMFLLLLLPSLISTFKPTPLPATSSAPGTSNGKSTVDDHDDHDDHDIEASHDGDKSKKPKPTRLQLGREIRFDLRLTRCSLVIDIIANLLVAIAPAPTFSAHSLLSGARPPSSRPKGGYKHPAPEWTMTRDQSQTLFVLASSLNSFASGMVPAVHSLALCIIQARGLDPDFGIEGYGSAERQLQMQEETDEEVDAHARSPPIDTGSLFGAFAVLQAVGQMILGPMLFGMVYSGTVSNYPKTVFVVATGLLVVSLVLILIVKNPVGEVRLDRRNKKFKQRMEMGYGAFGYNVPGPNGTSGYHYVGGGKRKGRGRNWEEEIEKRGRKRASKDLRGGAVRYYSNGQGQQVQKQPEGDERTLSVQSA